jgi:hypothetical protein
MEAQFTKLWKDVQTRARDFASRGLTASSKALATTASRLKTWEDGLKTRAEKLHAAKVEVVKTDAPAAK